MKQVNKKKQNKKTEDTVYKMCKNARHLKIASVDKGKGQLGILISYRWEGTLKEQLWKTYCHYLMKLNIRIA